MFCIFIVTKAVEFLLEFHNRHYLLGSMYSFEGYIKHMYFIFWSNYLLASAGDVCGDFMIFMWGEIKRD